MVGNELPFYHDYFITADNYSRVAKTAKTLDNQYMDE